MLKRYHYEYRDQQGAQQVFGRTCLKVSEGKDQIYRREGVGDPHNPWAADNVIKQERRKREQDGRNIVQGRLVYELVQQLFKTVKRECGNAQEEAEEKNLYTYQRSDKTEEQILYQVRYSQISDKPQVVGIPRVYRQVLYIFIEQA